MLNCFSVGTITYLKLNKKSFTMQEIFILTSLHFSVCMTTTILQDFCEQVHKYKLVCNTKLLYDTLATPGTTADILTLPVRFMNWIRRMSLTDVTHAWPEMLYSCHRARERNTSFHAKWNLQCEPTHWHGLCVHCSLWGQLHHKFSQPWHLLKSVQFFHATHQSFLQKKASSALRCKFYHFSWSVSFFTKS